MQALHGEKDSLQGLLSTTKDPLEMAKTGKRLKVIDADLATLEERWLELSEQIETATA